MNREELIKVLVAYISSDPSVVPDVLNAVSEGMVAWGNRVRASLDSAADWGISAALNMPTDSRYWNVKKHGSTARMVAVGWNLGRRNNLSQEEKELLAFVRRADLDDPESALGHYRILDAEPMPQEISS